VWDLISRRSSEAPVEVSSDQPRPSTFFPRHFFSSLPPQSPEGRGKMGKTTVSRGGKTPRSQTIQIPYFQQEEVDPGEIEGTDLRVLKYPHPKLRAFDEEITEFDADLKKVSPRTTAPVSPPILPYRLPLLSPLLFPLLPFSFFSACFVWV
jgi:hypothetical protein